PHSAHRAGHQPERRRLERRPQSPAAQARRIGGRMSDKTPLLSVRNLTIPLPSGGDRRYAVHNVSYDVHEGEILCIVGESGSGKSMSANAIMGLLPDYLTPTQGRILFNGVNLLEQPEDRLQAMRGREIGMIFQEPLSALNPLMTIGKQISEVMQVHNAYPGEQ